MEKGRDKKQAENKREPNPPLTPGSESGPELRHREGPPKVNEGRVRTPLPNWGARICENKTQAIIKTWRTTIHKTTQTETAGNQRIFIKEILKAPTDIT